ncbi:hypothetical protein BT69DRAFT_1347544 [Atractiella rhizophila]|nr:hypothetical protein BT69DRAFT_1347544 [Atractiella rhizophila]
MRRGGDRGKMLGKKYEELKAAAIEAGEEHLFLQAEKIKAASESSFHSFKVSHADDESTARAYMQKAKREINNVSAAAHCEFVIFCVSSQARNGAFKMEASSDNASSFVNTLLTENCIQTKGMTHGLSILNYMAAYIQSPHTLPSRIARSEAVNKREPVYHLRKHEDQLHSLDDCQYRDEKETYAKKLLKRLASNALQQDFKEWPVAKFDKIFKGWSFHCKKSDVLSAEDFVHHMQAASLVSSKTKLRTAFHHPHSHRRHTTSALVDSGATTSFISPKLVSEYNLPVTQLPFPVPVYNIDDGSLNQGGSNHSVAYLPISIAAHHEVWQFTVAELGTVNMILGHDG